MLALVLLAIFIRVWMVLMDHPHTPGGDEGLFIKIANSIVSGEGFSFRDDRYPCNWQPGMATAARAPGAPYWLAGWFALLGPNLLIPRLVVATASGACTYLMFLLGRRHSVAAGFAAAGLWAIWLSAIASWYGVTSVIAEPLALVCVIIALYSFVRGIETQRTAWGLLSGVGVGFASLLRPPCITLLLLTGIWVLIFERKRARVLVLAAALAGQLLIQAPWVIRNWILLGGFIPVASYSTTNFYVSNNPLSVANKGACNQENPEFEPEAVAEMERLSEIEVSRYCWQKGWNFIRNNPNDFIYLVVRRMILLFDPTLELVHPFSTNKKYIDAPYILLILLFAASAIYCWQDRYWWLLLIWSFNFVYAHILITTHPRYRQMGEVFVILMVAPVIGRLWLQGPRGRAALLSMGGVAVLLFSLSEPALALLRAIL